MASLSSNKDYVCISCGNKTCIVSLSSCEVFCLDHLSVKGTACKNIDKSALPEPNCRGVGNEDIGIGLTCCDLSTEGNLLAFGTLTKLLCVAATSQSGVVIKSVYSLARGASKIKFTPSGKGVVVADKSGDVYLFDLAKVDQEGQLILGHLSMLLDVLVTPDEQFIITCDRDEKIRVSRFPNGYNIVAYCLGHCEFVSSILLYPSNNSYLISASGDGTVRFWEFKIGKEVAVCNTNLYFEKADVDTLAITDTASIAIDSATSIVCVTLESVKSCLIIQCSLEGKKFNFCLNQRLVFEESNPWKLTLNGNILWVVLNDKDKVKVNAMKFCHDSKTFVENVPENVKKTVSIMNDQVMDVDFKKIVNLLFKRKFDNVQEYLNKKEARMEMESSNKKVKI